MGWPFKRQADEEAPRDRALEITVPPAVGVVAEVVRNAPPMTTMFKEGRAVQIQLADVAQMQELGFVLYDSEEVRGMARAVSEFLGPLPTIIMTFVDKAIAEGVIDPEEEHELHILTRRWNEADKQLQHLLTVISQMYPIKER